MVTVFIRVRLVNSGAPKVSWGLFVFRITPGVVRFFGVCLHHSGLLRWSSGLLECAWIIGARPVYRRVPSRSLSSFWFSAFVVWFIRVLFVHSGALLWSSGSFGSIRARRDGRRVHSRSFGSLRCAPRVVGFTRVRLVHSGAPLMSYNSF